MRRRRAEEDLGVLLDDAGQVRRDVHRHVDLAVLQRGHPHRVVGDRLEHDRLDLRRAAASSRGRPPSRSPRPWTSARTCTARCRWGSCEIDGRVLARVLLGRVHRRPGGSAMWLRKIGHGFLVWIRTVYGSTISTRSIGAKDDEPRSLLAGLTRRSRLNFTDSALKSSPLWNLTPRRSLNSHVVGATSFGISAASAGTSLRLWSRSSSDSNIWRADVRRRLLLLVHHVERRRVHALRDHDLAGRGGAAPAPGTRSAARTTDDRYASDSSGASLRTGAARR